MLYVLYALKGSRVKIIILGAGPCGLGAACQLQMTGHSDWRLYEGNSRVGGLSASFLDGQGFTWDIGGHVLFSHYDFFDRVVSDALGDAWYEHQRESWVRIMQRWVPYPFQNNIRHLPDEALRECIAGLRSLKGSPDTAVTFREWLDSVFGSGIVRLFMEPYNRKVWGTPLESMDKGWIAERVSVVDLARIERNITEGRDDLSWGPNNTFRFPRRGGTGAIYEAIADRFRDRICLNHEMTAVDTGAKQVRFADGRTESYDVLISTVPLDRLVLSCSTAPEQVRQAAGRLVHNSGLIVGAGFDTARNDTRCWMYFPEDTGPFYRVTNFHNYSPYNVPGGDRDNFSSLMCETTYSPHKPEDRDTIVERTVQGLVDSGMIDESTRKRVVSRFLIDIPYSYPVPALGRDRALDIIQPWLESASVYSRGRFGSWKYEVGNMDHSFMQGVEVVERILNGSHEPTINGR